MTATPDTRRSIARAIPGAGAVLVVLGLMLWQPWDRTPPAYRPDTGEAAARLDGDSARAVLTELLNRVYFAFGQEEEGAIYDGLATAVSSDLVTELYLQRRAAQEAELQEGGTSIILDVALDEMTILEDTPQGYLIDAAWTVTGEVGHEDHRHERINAYSAKVTLGPADAEWRLTGFDLNRIEREETPEFFFEDLQ